MVARLTSSLGGVRSSYPARLMSLVWPIVTLCAIGLSFEEADDSARLSIAPARVTADRADVLDRPQAAGLPTLRLRRGDRVEVVLDPGASIPADWRAILPPPGSFSWVASDAVSADSEGRLKVLRSGTLTRAAGPSARWPGAAWRIDATGVSLRKFDHEPLVVRSKGVAKEWIAIEPPEGELRFIPESAIEILGANEGEGARKPARVAISRTSVSRSNSTDEQSHELVAVSAPVPTDFSRALAQIDSKLKWERHRPMEEWRLEPIVQSYREAAARAPDRRSMDLVASRIEETERLIGLSRSAKSFRALLDKSRTRDERMLALERKRAHEERSRGVDYDATGLLQPTSQIVHGQKAYALIARDGGVACYLLIPPGVDPNPLTAHRVGVRGAVHYDEDLRAKLIDLNEIELAE